MGRAIGGEITAKFNLSRTLTQTVVENLRWWLDETEDDRCRFCPMTRSGNLAKATQCLACCAKLFGFSWAKEEVCPCDVLPAHIVRCHVETVCEMYTAKGTLKKGV